MHNDNYAFSVTYSLSSTVYRVFYEIRLESSLQLAFTVDTSKRNVERRMNKQDVNGMVNGETRRHRENQCDARIN